MAAREKIETVLAVELVEDFTLYPRLAVNDIHVAALTEALLAGAVLPPVIADRQSKRLSDGWHRRRATMRAFGTKAEIGVIFRNYANDGEILLDAVRLNAGHGRRLTIAEQVRIVHLASELGVSRDDVAKALAVRIDVLEDRVEKRTAFDPASRAVPIKPALLHLAGDRLTPEQMAANKHLGGHQARYLARQLLMLVRADAIDWQDARLVVLLTELSQELAQALGANAA